MVTWLVSDNLGSTNIGVDSTGTLINTFKYTAFGELRTTSGTNSTDYLYTGQRNEADTGLYFYKARFYDPTLGRFIQPDTLVPDATCSKAFDRYAYVNNNPMNFNDPSGHKSCDSFDRNGNCIPEYKVTRTISDGSVSPVAKSFSMQFIFGDYLGQEGQVGGILMEYGLDVVVTKDTNRSKSQIALFLSHAIPHPAINSTIPLYFPLALAGPQRDSIRENPYRVRGEGRLVTPQVGISFALSSIWGSNFATSGIDAYEGPSTHTGFSVKGFGHETSISNNPVTGELDSSMFVDGFSYSNLSVPIVEYHSYVTDSSRLTGIANTPGWVYFLFFGE